MLLMIPYRVKNPVKTFPVLTVTLIAIHIALYAIATTDIMHLRPDVLAKSSFAFGISPLWMFFIAILYHADIVQLLANMLFLWVFGPAVEERLGTVKFLAVYFISALVGGVYMTGLDYIYTNAIHPWVGATASVMGIAGAYWYIYSWSQVSVFYWFVLWYGSIDIAALWVVGIFIVADIVQGIFYNSVGVAGGVANISHIASAASAVLICVGLHVKRDSEAVSDAKALRADDLDLKNMPVEALQVMLEEDPTDIELIRALEIPALRHGNLSALTDALTKAGPKVIEKDPRLIARYLIDMRGDIHIYKPAHLLHLAGLLERRGEPQRAIVIYRMIVDRYPQHHDAEVALYRMAFCSWNSLHDASAAHAYIDEIEWRFPHGEMIEYARILLRKLPPMEQAPES